MILWAQTRQIPLAIALVLAGTGLAWFMRIPMSQLALPDVALLAAALPAAAVAIALEPRESPRERGATRPVERWDAALVMVLALTGAGVLLGVDAARDGPSQLVDLALAFLFACGLATLLCTVVGARSAAGGTALVLFLLLLTYRVVGGTRGAVLALVHEQSPLWTSSLAGSGMLLAGLAALLLIGRPRRSPVSRPDRRAAASP